MATGAKDAGRRDARATGRTRPLATRVTEDFHRQLRVYAAQHDLKLVEVLEIAFEALQERDRQGLPPLRRKEGK
jgi:hypothetical protein